MAIPSNIKDMAPLERTKAYLEAARAYTIIEEDRDLFTVLRTDSSGGIFKLLTPREAEELVGTPHDGIPFDTLAQADTLAQLRKKKDEYIKRTNDTDLNVRTLLKNSDMLLVRETAAVTRDDEPSVQHIELRGYGVGNKLLVTDKIKNKKQQIDLRSYLRMYLMPYNRAHLAELHQLTEQIKKQREVLMQMQKLYTTRAKELGKKHGFVPYEEAYVYSDGIEERQQAEVQLLLAMRKHGITAPADDGRKLVGKKG